ncbi:hypothetical protein BJY04DRAFT_219042 [Aspergillus karnatakaensis]|uniref:uncharacterized protein n=1 Tax=Aspergillus karnatakaensis TaxID=1810916 RepID=UPI003CCDE1F6
MNPSINTKTAAGLVYRRNDRTTSYAVNHITVCRRCGNEFLPDAATFTRARCSSCQSRAELLFAEKYLKPTKSQREAQTEHHREPKSCSNIETPDEHLGPPPTEHSRNKPAPNHTSNEIEDRRSEALKKQIEDWEYVDNIRRAVRALQNDWISPDMAKEVQAHDAVARGYSERVLGASRNKRLMWAWFWEDSLTRADDALEEMFLDLREYGQEDEDKGQHKDKNGDMVGDEGEED